jgi:hypothetical protein
MLMELAFSCFVDKSTKYKVPAIKKSPKRGSS